MEVSRFAKELTKQRFVMDELDKVLSPPPARRRHRAICFAASQPAELLHRAGRDALHQWIGRRVAHVPAHYFYGLCGRRVGIAGGWNTVRLPPELRRSDRRCPGERLHKAKIPQAPLACKTLRGIVMYYTCGHKNPTETTRKPHGKGKNMANVTELKPSDTQKTSDIPPEFEPETAPGTEPKAAKPPNRGGRPPKGKDSPTEAKSPRFFDRVSEVDKADWGTRAFMYVYVQEPACNPKTFGETRFILKSSAPITDLEGLKQDYGSFKGYMTLNLRKSGKDGTDEVDRLDFEIYDPKHPPKIPRKAWANDPRNARWEALLPPEAPPASAATASFLDSMKVYKEIVADIKSDTKTEAAAPVDPTNATLQTMKLAKELFAAPAVAAPPTPPDPLQTAVKLAETMMQMRADNPVIDMYRDELKALREELKEERAESRKAQTAQQPASAPKSFIEQVKELAGLGEALKPLAGILGLGGPAEAVAGRAVKPAALDYFREFTNSPMGTALGSGLGNVLSAFASRATAPPQAPPGQPQQPPPVVINRQQPDGTAPPQEPREARILRIAQTITRPMLYEYFLTNEDGDDFAAWMFKSWPDDYVFVRSMGADEIVRRYKEIPVAWAIIAAREKDFVDFIGEFCAWDPDAAEEPAQGEPADDGIVDLTDEGDKS